MKSFSRFLNEDYSFRLGGSSKKGFKQNENSKENLIETTRDLAGALYNFTNKLTNEFIHGMILNYDPDKDAEMYVRFAVMNSELKDPIAIFTTYLEHTGNLTTYYEYPEKYDTGLEKNEVEDPYEEYEDRPINLFYTTAFCFFNKYGSDNIDDWDCYTANSSEVGDDAYLKSVSVDKNNKDLFDYIRIRDDYEQKKIYVNIELPTNVPSHFGEPNIYKEFESVSADSTFSIKFLNEDNDKLTEWAREKQEIGFEAAKYTFRNRKAELKIDLYHLPDFDNLAVDLIKNINEIEEKFDD